MIIIALGSNQTSVWGNPHETLSKALDEISRQGVQVTAQSKLYKTEPYGPYQQDDFLNAVALIDTPAPAPSLLKMLKAIEAQAGRKRSLRWGPRPLDLDIIDYKKVICNWKMRRPVPGRRVILPHAEAHKRAFVLRPLAEIAPEWHHPVFGLSASALLKNSGVANAGAVLAVLPEDRH